MYFWSKRKKLIFAVFAMVVLYFAIRLGESFLDNRMLLSMNFCADYGEVIHGEEKQDLDVRNTLRFNGCNVPYVTETNTFYISQDTDTDIWEGYFSAGNDADIYFCNDAMWSQKLAAIESDYKFSVLIQMGDYYRLANLTVSGLPILSLTETAGMEDPSDFVIIDADEDMSYSGYCNSHLRGQTSATYPKKGYKINLCNKRGKKKRVSLLGLRKDNDWILNPLYTDSSKIREKLAYQMWSDMQEYNDSKDKSSNIMYVEYIFDNMYWGVYGLMEPVDNKQLSMNKTDIFYRKTDFAIPDQTEFNTEDGQEYIPGFRIKYPKLENVTSEDWLHLKPYVTTFYYDIYDHTVKTESDWSKLESLIDIDNIIDYEIFLNCIRGEDNIFKNIDYCMRFENGSYKMHMIPWDMDNSFGNYGVGSGIDQKSGRLPDIMVSREFITLYRADQERMENLTREKWQEYRKNFLDTEYLQKYAQQNMDLLVKSGAMKRDSEKWPDANNFTDTSRFMEYIKECMDSLDKVFCGDNWWKYNELLKREDQ